MTGVYLSAHRVKSDPQPSEPYFSASAQTESMRSDTFLRDLSLSTTEDTAVSTGAQASLKSKVAYVERSGC